LATLFVAVNQIWAGVTDCLHALNFGIDQSDMAGAKRPRTAQGRRRCARSHEVEDDILPGRQRPS
jgi:hypothetical protein